ncbi:hypothetical protein [Caldibacillus phage CBP1]|nr:hypothetical protein [Caldibacillus phage CBP1]
MGIGHFPHPKANICSILFLIPNDCVKYFKMIKKTARPKPCKPPSSNHYPMNKITEVKIVFQIANF